MVRTHPRYIHQLHPKCQDWMLLIRNPLRWVRMSLKHSVWSFGRVDQTSLLSTAKWLTYITQGEQHEGISMKFPASARRPGQQSLLLPFRPIVNQPLLRQMGELSMAVRFLETQKGTASSLWEEYIPAGELIKCCCYQNNWHNAVQTTISWFPASWSWSSNANFLLQYNCRASTMLVSGRWLIILTSWSSAWPSWSKGLRSTVNFCPNASLVL